MYKKEFLALFMILANIFSNAQAFEEISCETYYGERAYFGTSQQSITVQNKTDRWLKLTYKNGEQKEFDIIPRIAPGETKKYSTFNNATLSFKDIRSGACLRAIRLNPDDLSGVMLELSRSKVLKEISRQDPATGQSILKIDCAYIKEEFKNHGGRGALSIENETDGPMAIHRIQSTVGKVGRPIAVIPPSGAKKLFSALGERFMLKDKMGQCVGVYEVLGDATLNIDKKELAKPGAAPFEWEDRAKAASMTNRSSGNAQTLKEVPKDGLALWLKADSGVNVVNKRVTSWQDLSGKGWHVNQKHWKYAPIYQVQGLNGEPALYFSNAYLKTDGSFLKGKEYTAFVVHHRQTYHQNNFMITGGEALANQGIGLGYEMNSASHGHGSNSINTEIFAHHINKASLMTFRLSKKDGRSIYVNDELIASRNEENDRATLLALDHLAIGGYQTTKSFFSGHIAEVLIYDRSLEASQIKEIQTSLMGKYALGQSIKNPASPPELISAKEPQDFEPTLLDLPLPDVSTMANLIDSRRDRLTNTTLQASLNAQGIDIPYGNMNLWLKADAGVEATSLNARSQRFIDQGAIEPWSGTINYVDRWVDQSGSGNDAMAVKGLSHFRPALIDDGNSLRLRFGLKRMKRTDAGENELKFMIGQKLKVSTEFLNQSSYTIFVVHKPSEELPEGFFSGSFLSNQSVKSKDPQTGRPLSGSRLIYGYTQKSQSTEINELMLIQDRSEQMLGKNRFNTITRKLPMDNFQKQVLTVRLDTLLGTDYWISSQNLFGSFDQSHPMDGLDSLLIGAGPSSAFSGDIYEIIMYNTALSDEEIGRVQQYLVSKYDVEGHPISLGNDFRYHGLNSFNADSEKETIRAATFYVDFPDYPGSEAFPETPLDSVQAFYDRWTGGKIHFEPIVYEKSWKRHATAAPQPKGIKVPNGSKIQKTFMDQSQDFDFSQYNVTHTIYPKVPDYERANVNSYGKFADRKKLAANISLGNRVHDDPNYHKTIIHEYGHIFGLPDLYYEDDDGVGPEIVNTQATGSWSLMADAFGSKNLLLWELFYLGWLPEGRMQYVKDDWEGEILQHETGTGTWLLIIPTDPLVVYHTSFYCVEVPQKPNPENTEGVLVYFVDTNKKTSLLPVEVMKTRLSETWEAPLTTGEELSNEQMPFSIKVLQETNEGYRVKITRK